ncbi:hypothetical protein PTSG_00925 [Salpingoeca rosetta]|uniref:Uncharacterized protein n=1 Tax=Salpingoeca rosetta (strain ATCC 50818 / BSB-021) TaxID=946362 RepID=F2TXW3_SALR5|nr:uncharacterized protein PTSG_00925 [Salpingoeca rosetta]EGD76222.1 hypothetical protein PTSG_00925 [Salpingoeca rosetta]|eukprot:XP_004998397.1 hypothetical protein PTSG_00925 [Salpingoeca rosetta]
MSRQVRCLWSSPRLTMKMTSRDCSSGSKPPGLEEAAGVQTNATAKWMDSYQRHFSDTDKLNEWMMQVKRAEDHNLEGDKVVGALMGFLLHGMFAGNNGLSSAVFWASLLETAGADDCTLLYTDLVDVCQSGLVPRDEEQCDTFFRALFIKNDPDLDVFLRQYADDCYVGAAGFQAPEGDASLGDMWTMRLESIRNMFPVQPDEQKVLRQPVTAWQLPALDMRGFRDVVLQQRMVPYAYTAHNFFQLRSLQHMAKDNTGSSAKDFEEALYPAAGMLSGCVLDSLWARYFVTHDPACLDRLMEVAGAAVHFIRAELGEKKGVNRFIRALTMKEDATRAVADLAGTNLDGRLIMSAGTSACLSLIENSEQLPGIWEHVEEQRAALHRNSDNDNEALGTSRMRDAGKLLSVVKAAKDIAKLTNARLDNQDS